MSSGVVIVGAGLAGSRCAQTLRAEGFDGPITLVGEEPHPPYERPALSKEFLAGTREELLLPAADRLGRSRDRPRARGPGGADRHDAPAREHDSRRLRVGRARSRDRSPGPAARGLRREWRPCPSDTRRSAAIACRARSRPAARDRRIGLRRHRGCLDGRRARGRRDDHRPGERAVRADARAGGRPPPRRTATGSTVSTSGSGPGSKGSSAGAPERSAVSASRTERSSSATSSSSP